MSVELSMNGRKKIETLQKEFSNKFPYLNLIFFDDNKQEISKTKTLSEIRKKKGDDISIIASLKVNSLEKKFITNYGIIVEVAYFKNNQVVITEEDENRTLNELNKWCELNECTKVNLIKLNSSNSNTETVAEKDEIFSEDRYDYNHSKLQEIKNFIKLLRSNIDSNENVYAEIYTEDYVSQYEIEECFLSGKKIEIKRTNWWEDSYWESNHSVSDMIEIILNLYEYGTFEFDEENTQWYLQGSGENDNGCDLELYKSELVDSDQIPSEVLNEDGEIDLWELRDYCGTKVIKTESLDFEEIDFTSVKIKFLEHELNIDLSEVSDIVLSGNYLIKHKDPNELLLKNKAFFQIIKENLQEYDSKILFNNVDDSNSLSFKFIPFLNDNSYLKIFEEDDLYYMKFFFNDIERIAKLLQFKPDILKQCDGGVCIEKGFSNVSSFYKSLINFICLIRMKQIEFNDGLKIYYVGMNYYSDSINGKPKYQILTDKEASIFDLYDDVIIGNQTWSERNLQSTFFRNGDSIFHAKTNEDWMKAFENQIPAWCYYENNPTTEEKYGKLYNWHAVNDPRGLAPEGWKIPSENDYQKLVNQLGGNELASTKLKSTEYWNKEGTDEYNFNALPGGYRHSESKFDFINKIGFFWTSNDNGDKGRFFSLSLGNNQVAFGSGDKNLGLSVRCIK